MDFSRSKARLKIKIQERFDTNLDINQIISKRIESKFHPKGLSWGIFFLIMTTFRKKRLSEKDYNIAAVVELLMITTDLFDDGLDDDLDNAITNNESFVLSTQLLLDALKQLEMLCSHSEYQSILNNLKKSMAGEWIDIHSNLNSETYNEDFYFHNMVDKSIGLIKLVTQLADLKNEEFWSEISHYLAIALQIQNDIQDITDERNNDLRLGKATLPLIKAIEFSREEQPDFYNILQNLWKTSSHIQDLPYIIGYIRNCGSIEYCNLLANRFFIKAFDLIVARFPDNKESITLLTNFLKRRPV